MQKKKPQEKKEYLDDILYYYNKMTLEDWTKIRTEKFWLFHDGLQFEDQKKKYILRCCRHYFGD